MAIAEHILYSLPLNTLFVQAAMLEAVSVAIHAVCISASGRGETALVVGASMIGLLTLQAARRAGFKRVFVTDVDVPRLVLAGQVGAGEAFPSVALTERILTLTLGRGVDHVFEAVGRCGTAVAAIKAASKGSTVALIGNTASEIKLPLREVVTSQVRLQGSCASAGE